MIAELGLALGAGGSFASIISLKPLIEAELAARRQAGSIVDSAITPAHRQIVRKIVQELSGGCWRHSELKSAYKRTYSSVERIKPDFWNGFDNDRAVDLACELCKTYVECGFDFEKMKQTSDLFEEAKKFFSPEDDEVFDNNMRQLIPIFAYFLADDPRIAAQWIARDLRVLHEKMERKESVRERYHVNIEEECAFAKSVIDGPMYEIVHKNEDLVDAKIHALYYILLAARDKQVREVIERAGDATGGVGGNCGIFWSVFERFLAENNLDTIRTCLFSTTKLLVNENEFTNSPFEVKDAFRKNIIQLFLSIAFLKSDKVTAKPIIENDNSDVAHNYMLNYHCKGLEDLEVLVSFYINKRIDLDSIDSSYCMLEFAEKGISQNEVSTVGTDIWNMLTTKSMLDSKNESAIKENAQMLNTMAKEVLEREYRECLVIVFSPEAERRYVSEMCALLPHVVFVQKDETDNASELFNKMMAGLFQIHIDRDLR